MCFERLKMKEVTIVKKIANFDLTPEVIAKLSDELKSLYDEDKMLDDNYSQYLTKFFERLKKHVIAKEVKKQIMQEETVAEIRKNYKPEFIAEVLNIVSKYNYRFHATNSASVESIMQSGLKFSDASLTGDLNNTSVALSNLSDDEILYNLFNRMHKYQKQIVVLSNDARVIHENGKHYLVPTNQIKGYIDIEHQKVVKNPEYISSSVSQTDLRQIGQSNSNTDQQTQPTVNELMLSTVDYLNDTMQIHNYADIDNYNAEMYHNIVWLYNSIVAGNLDYDSKLFEKYHTLMLKYNTEVQNKIAEMNKTI